MQHCCIFVPRGNLHIAFKIVLLLIFSSQVAHVWHHLSEDTAFHQFSTEDDSFTSEPDHGCDLCQLELEDVNFQPLSFEIVCFSTQEEFHFSEPHDFFLSVCFEQNGRDPPALSVLTKG